ncbi:zinc finger CCCH domain-containing protein 14 [Elysia marginata]|uniref:Zinc finger CCCH domain-containing protein 14 n=1 Tax=Elysia marginata TaxID=1093978 RepID=A0AAV4GP33_9GAST|nr:zinc finger CCCH domain-containing protein 14 [Elysia marginata]
MEVGTEISQKIRSAIKAKLMELGAYVDDELPDYIMVMVANKKNKSQMKSDLSLFLGANTDTFTSWLHGLLGKLQTITVESGKDKTEKSKNKEKKKAKSGPGGLKSKTDLSKSKKLGKEKSRKRKSSRDGVEDAPKAKSAMSESVENETTSNETQNSSQSKNGDKNQETGHKDEDESEKESLQVTDDQSEAIEASNHKQTHVHEEFEDVRQLLVAATPGDDLAKELDATEEEISTKKSGIQSQDVDAPNKISQKKAVTSSFSGDSQREQNTITRRKVPSSVVAAVSREDDEEYDPFNPAVGNVASVVKVTSRKASFPPSMQANRQESTGDVPLSSDHGADPDLSQNFKEFDEIKNKAQQTVDLEVVKQALSEVLEKFQYSGKQDEIGCFVGFVERTLRQFDHVAFIQAKTKILQLFSSFDSKYCSPSGQFSRTVNNKSLNGEDKALKSILTSNTSDSKFGDVPCTLPGTKVAVNEFEGPERIIFSSKSTKSPMLTSSEQGSEFYRSFVSSILKPSSQQSSSEGNSSTNQDGSNTPTQPLVSSTRLEVESPRAGLASSSHRSKALAPLSSTSTIKLTHAPSPSSTSSPSISQSAIIPKVPGMDPGFHRLRSQILVDSLHVRRRPDSSSSSPSTSLLQHAWRRRQTGDKHEGDSVIGEGGTSSPASQSPPHYSCEALKGLAKNLRVTIINRQAKGLEESSSGEDSSSDEDSDEEEDEEDSSDENKELQDAKDNHEKIGDLSNKEK